ncbi:MAG: hypothetical protein K8S87_09770 [Planctomycetes bacterium]|nr:hypothetical protein [Planctomycetota bacterium]
MRIYNYCTIFIVFIIAFGVTNLGCKKEEKPKVDEINNQLRLTSEITNVKGNFTIRCLLKNYSDSKSFFTEYSLNNGCNQLIQFYLFSDGQPIENPNPIGELYPDSVLKSSWNFPFSLKPDEIKPGNMMKILEEQLDLKKKGNYEMWFTLFLPNDETNVEEFVYNDVGTTLKSNVIRMTIE